MKTHKTQQQPKQAKAAKSHSSPDDVNKPSERDGTELSDHKLDRVTGGEPPDPCIRFNKS
jgi:hypothetical protein